jgi:DNA-binding CsgD family transcriptional regulator
MTAFPDEGPVSAPRGSSDVYLWTWASTHRSPIVILAPDLTVLWENDAAASLFEDARHFVRSGGRMGCADKAQSAGFQSFLSSLPAAGGVWACRAEDGSHLLVRADELSPPGAERAAVLTLYPTGADRPSAWADLSQVFGLTAAEAGIARRLVGGERAEAVANDLGISLETVRTHVRRIYNKLSISSREELFSMINPFRVVLP